LNQVYRIVWSSSLGMFQVVSELACAQGRKSAGTQRKRARANAKVLAVAASLATMSHAAMAQVGTDIDGTSVTVGTSQSNSGVWAWDGSNLAVSGSVSGYGIFNLGTIGTLSNENGGTIAATQSNGDGRVNDPGLGAGIYNENGGTIGALTNSGLISGLTMSIYNDGTIGALSNGNGGTISGGTYAGIRNYNGSIGTLTNSGLIHALQGGISIDE